MKYDWKALVLFDETLMFVDNIVFADCYEPAADGNNKKKHQKHPRETWMKNQGCCYDARLDEAN